MKTLERPNFESAKKPEKQETEAKYHFEEIAELEKPMMSLAEQLKEAIDKGEYDTLISDDAGGRIPTLIMREIMATRMRKAHPEFTPDQERESLKTYFAAGGRAQNPDALKKFFKSIKSEVKNKALLITEYMDTGESILKLGKVLDKAKLPFDVLASCTLSSKSNLIYYAEEFYKNHQLYVGEQGKFPKLYLVNHRLGGIEKVEGSKEPHPHILPKLFGIEEDIKQAREDVKLMAKRILEKVWPEK